MDNISFKLDVFEGPLDLLLHLISKHKLNINDIEISKLLEQYLLYIEQAKEKKINDVVQQKVVSVISKVVYVLKNLYANGKVYIDRLFDGMTGRSERVATFLAILELTKSGRIMISDDNTMVYFKKKVDNLAV